MKKMLLFTALLIALSASAAMAAGVNVSWGNACWADAGHASSLTWACNSNTFSGPVLPRMTCSFQVAQDKTNFVATDIYMEGITDDVGTLCPDWWKLGAGECRANAVTMSADASVQGCLDLWTAAGGGGGGIGLYSDDTNRTHLNASWAVADPLAIFAGDENFAVQFRIATTKTVGTGACAGCLTPMTWALNRIQVAYQLEESEVLDFVIPGGNQCLSWNGGAAPCAPPIPARNTTWGQVKSLYR
jgi:type 1 fimbria pilin